MRKYTAFLMFICIMCLTGCGKQAEDDEIVELGANQLYAYFVNTEQTDLVPVVYNLNVGEDDILSTVTTLVNYLIDTEPNENYRSPVPSVITFDGCQQGSRKGNIILSFKVSYEAVDAQTLLFFKGCVVQTLIQLKDVHSVTISMTDIANADTETATVTETFDADSFMLTFGNASGFKQKGTLVLYFANESGDLLKEYRKSIEISNNSSLARIVLESLITGPLQEGYTATISENTVIHNVSVKDGICYVDLSDEFYDINNPLKNDIIVYSVVNSLCELPTVSKVQFLRGGEKQSLFRESMPFDGIFERNLDLIGQEE